MPGIEDESSTAALRRSEELYARAFLQNPLPMTLTNAETNRFIAANEEFLKLAGFWRAEVIGATSAELELWPERASRGGVGEQLEMDGMAGPMRGGIRGKGGVVVPCVLWFRLLKVESGRTVLTVLVPTEHVANEV